MDRRTHHHLAQPLPQLPNKSQPQHSLLLLNFKATDTPWAPWHVVRSDDKKRARLNTIAHLLSMIPYEELPRDKPQLPKRQKPHGYAEPNYPYKYVPELGWPVE